MNSASERLSTEVRNLLQSLNEHNYESVVHDLSQYFDNGAEESMRVMATCLDHFDIYEDDFEGTDLEPTIGSLFRNLMHKHHFSTAFSGLMRNKLMTKDFLYNLSTTLKLSVREKIGFGFNLLDAENYDIRTEGRKFCMSQCEALCNIRDKLDTVEADVQDVLSFLEQSDVLSKLVDSFKVMILQVWLNANSHLILADKVDETVLLSHINFHISVPKEIPTKMRASLFAKMLGYWNRLSYRCGELRAEGLQLRADVAFSVLMSCYRHACQAPFPLDVVLGNVWENKESQLLFLKHAVSSPPEVFTFAHCKRQLECVDHESQADHASQPWLCLDLLEMLCQLAEKGHTTSVWSMMEFPLKHCPEVLLLGMAHVITPYNLLQHEVAKSVLPMLLNDSSKSGTILRVWGVKPLLISRALNHSLILDLENMNRIVDLFQELEILSSVLDLVPMHLGIKLASLASRKEFVDLVEWLGTNLSAHEDDFYEECLRFLKEVEDNAGDIWNIYKETAPAFTKALQRQTEVLASKELSEKMESLYVTCMQDSSKKENIDDFDSSTSESYADHITEKMQESSSPSSGSTSRQGPVTSAMFGGAISIDTLLAASKDRETPVEVPPSETQDKIMFLINNLSPANIEEKAKAFTDILAERYYPWFAQYLVMRRAGIEANFHNQYINFLEKIRSKQVNNEIVQATYENCKVLLRSDLIKSSVEERKLLKNLGSWLGKLTIGRNQPLLAKHIDPKSLIAEAYEKGLMIGVIPFISKILELCQSSIAYQLPNPWTMAILGLLVEVYSMPNLKANLTFEIEVLFKNLNVDIKEVKPTTLLKDKARMTEGNPDFSQPKIVEEVKSTVRHAVNQVVLPADVASPSYQVDLSQIVYQPTVPASNIPDFQSVLKTHVLGLLPMAMNKAIEELVSTVVERSVSIASQTAIELVLKEYINDPDEIYIDNVSSCMVASLAGSLSSVTCKEPLRVLTSTHLRNSAKGLNVPSEFLEDAMKCVIDENLHLGCASIEKNATEKGLAIVKREITQELSIRKKQKEGSMSIINKTFEPSYTTDVALDRVQVLLTKLEGLIANGATEVQIQSVAAEVRAVILKCIRGDEAALSVARKVFEGLYENAFNTANVDSRLTILAVICDVNKLVGKELTGWVLETDDRKFNKYITVGLIRKRLLNVEEYSFHLARIVSAGKSGAAIEYAVSLVKTLETSDARVLPELHNLMDALSKVTYHPVAGNDDNQALKSSEPDPLRGQVSVFLAEWYRMRAHSGISDAVCAPYVQELYRNVLSISDDMSNRFFGILLELVISHYRPFEINPSPMQFHQQDTSSFLAIDIYTDVVFSVLKFYPDSEKSTKYSLLLKVLTVMVGFITKDANEKKSTFNPKPYFRLFSNILNQLNTVNSVILDADFHVLAGLAQSFHALQPAKVPEFSFAWLELVTLKDFMPKLLSQDDHQGWPYFKCLVIDVLRFMEPILRSGEVTEPVLVLYNYTRRMLLVLSHDFPEFICYYRSSLYDVIPPHCIELRNIILSTVPHNMRTPI